MQRPCATTRNFFNDPKKAEQTALQILEKVPSFKKFMRENSMLASLFQTNGVNPNAQGLVGLQTRASVNNLIQNQIASGWPKMPCSGYKKIFNKLSNTEPVEREL